MLKSCARSSARPPTPAGERPHWRQIVERLQANAAEAGEPLYRLPVLQMQIRCIVVCPLVVDYALMELQPLVFIKGARLF